ncbi:MAG: helix-turn-helix domain-containing protein [Pseudomonadales bacterium]|jgi:DNA-binding XRE family transcriptional regulator|nr:helix-turn-helix domain-containing protein [Pseudomonadales bacterium]
MTNLKYQPIAHNHEAFIARASKRAGFADAYAALELEYQLANQMLKARTRAGLTQDAVANLMGTTKSAISRLETSGKHAPSIATLKRYAAAVGCDLQVKLVPRKAGIA